MYILVKDRSNMELFCRQLEGIMQKYIIVPFIVLIKEARNQKLYMEVKQLCLILELLICQMRTR